MPRLFEVVEVTQDLPKFLLVGDSEITRLLALNLLSGNCQIYLLSNISLDNHPNLFIITPDKLERISDDVQYVFFEREPAGPLEFEVKRHFPRAKLIYLNPKSLKERSCMLFSPFIYGPGMIDKSFGFIAFNQKNIIQNQTLILPENVDQEIRPVFAADVVEIIEKIMFSNPSENLILLFGKESMSLVGFLGLLKSKIRVNLQTKYLEQKLSFKLPNIGRTEYGVTKIEKGVQETADYLNRVILQKASFKTEPSSQSAKPIPPQPVSSSLPISSSQTIIHSPPKHIPVVAQTAVDETDFALNNNFLRHVYHENLEYLRKNQLYSSGKSRAEFKKKEQNFAANLNKKRESIMVEIKKITLFPVKQVKLIAIKTKRVFFNSPKNLLKIFLKIFSGIIAALFIIVLPYVLFMVTLSASLFFFKTGSDNLMAQNLSESARMLSMSAKTHAIAKFMNHNIVRYYYQILGKQNSFRNQENFLSLEEKGIDIAKNSQGMLLNFSALAKTIVKKNKEIDDVDAIFTAANISAETVRDDLGSAIASLKHEIPSLPWFLRFKKQEYYDKLKKLPVYYKSLNQASLILQNLPDILGKKERKTYALLLQNNMELRSTGGFIGSFALISFEKEKLTDFSIFDVYDADGQLKGRIDPPPEILHFLKQPNWFLRDSNVNPDFPTSAAQAVWFLNKEMRADINGVIAVDISFVENLLGVTGPIHIRDYNDTVSSANLFEKAEKAAEQEFFPGSKQKKDYLSGLGRELWLKLLDLSNEDMVKILRVAENGAVTRHLQIYFPDEKLEKIAEHFKTDGKMITDKKQYLNLIENNYGANKANYFVKRHIQHQISIYEDGFVGHQVKIAYENFSPVAMWPTGIYKPYLKFYIPSDTIFKDFKWDNKPAKLSSALNENVLEEWKVASEQLLLQGEENGMQYFGSFFNIPIGGKKEAYFSYQLRTPNLENLKSFEYYFQKQAGTIKDSYDLTLLFPDSLSPKSNLAPSLVSKGRLEYNLNTEKDIDLKINFK